jgi:hypothetical protein
MEFISVACIGVFVGLAELVSRYRDQPSAVLFAPSAWLYMVLNGAASLAALSFAKTMGWDFGMADASQRALILILLCGFGAMGLIRTSFANIAVSGKDVSIGFVTVLDSLLYAADRGVDRARSRQRIKVATRIMRDVEFENAREALPATVLASLQNVSVVEAQKLRETLSAIAESDQTPLPKNIQLGLTLMNLAGPAALQEAVTSLHHDGSPQSAKADISTPKRGVLETDERRGPVGS